MFMQPTSSSTICSLVNSKLSRLKAVLQVTLSQSANEIKAEEQMISFLELTSMRLESIIKKMRTDHKELTESRMNSRGRSSARDFKMSNQMHNSYYDQQPKIEDLKNKYELTGSIRENLRSMIKLKHLSPMENTRRVTSTRARNDSRNGYFASGFHRRTLTRTDRDDLSQDNLNVNKSAETNKVHNRTVSGIVEVSQMDRSSFEHNKSRQLTERKVKQGVLKSFIETIAATSKLGIKDHFALGLATARHQGSLPQNSSNMQIGMHAGQICSEATGSRPLGGEKFRGAHLGSRHAKSPSMDVSNGLSFLSTNVKKLGINSFVSTALPIQNVVVPVPPIDFK
jgi:hypothetical protein